jgi:hypothetical protein
MAAMKMAAAMKVARKNTATQPPWWMRLHNSRAGQMFLVPFGPWQLTGANSQGDV